MNEGCKIAVEPKQEKISDIITAIEIMQEEMIKISKDISTKLYGCEKGPCEEPLPPIDGYDSRLKLIIKNNSVILNVLFHIHEKL